MTTPRPPLDPDIGTAGEAIAAPLILQDADQAAWSEQCDVLVLGFGAAGACAALEAAGCGADVLVCDRFDGGGASKKSGGVVYAGGGTAQQDSAGITDTPQAMFAYLRQETGDVVSEDNLRAFCENSPHMIAWLTSLGVVFDDSVPPRKTSYPADGYYLYYSGNEAVPACASIAAPAPRGHRVKGKGLSGAVLFGILKQAVEKAAVRIQRQAAAQRLIVDMDGQVLGAEVRRMQGWTAALHRCLIRTAESIHNMAPGMADALRGAVAGLEARHGIVARIRARHGVVLATGGFIFNRKMVAQHAPRYLPAWRLGATGCDGSGIRLGQSVGGACANMDHISAWRFINPPFAWARGMVVNAGGQRICNEEVYGARLGHAMCEQANGKAWLVLDARLRSEALHECLKGGMWLFQSGPALMLMLLGAVKGADVGSLAARLGMPPDQLASTLQAYNAAARGEAPDLLGKSAAMLTEFGNGPLYAIDISMDSKIFPCPVITLGGLRVDESSGAVLDADGQAVRGLYAAGRAALGIASNHYVSGLSLADCIWSGRRAGRATTANLSPI